MNQQDAITIGILETGNVRAELADEHGTFTDWFTRWLNMNRHTPLSFSTFRAHEGQLPHHSSACDAYLVTGSAASVIEQADWMLEAQNFIRAAADSRPVIGICFGHQLIADAYGGAVEASDNGWGVGVHTYDVHAHKQWMSPKLEQVATIASHMDQVTRAPDGAEVLAGNEFCPIGMLQIGENIITFQNHPEVTPAFAKMIYTYRREMIGEARADTALASLADDIHDQHFADWVATFLLDRIASRPPHLLQA